jgi:hypothetical protein
LPENSHGVLRDAVFMFGLRLAGFQWRHVCRHRGARANAAQRARSCTSTSALYLSRDRHHGNHGHERGRLHALQTVTGLARAFWLRFGPRTSFCVLEATTAWGAPPCIWEELTGFSFVPAVTASQGGIRGQDERQGFLLHCRFVPQVRRPRPSHVAAGLVEDVADALEGRIVQVSSAPESQRIRRKTAAPCQARIARDGAARSRRTEHERGSTRRRRSACLVPVARQSLGRDPITQPTLDGGRARGSGGSRLFC